MNKMVISAAVTAMIGTATAGLCTPEAAAPDGCSLYNVKFTFKTLAAKKACAEGAKWLVTDSNALFGKIWYRSTEADAMAEAVKAGTTVVASDYLTTPATFCSGTRTVAQASKRVVYWMDNATRKFDGVLWQCSSDCFEASIEDCENTNDGRIDYAIWEKKTSLPISYPVLAFKYYTDEDASLDYSAGDKIVGTEYVTLDASNQMWLGRYGKTAQKVAMAWAPELLHRQMIEAIGFGTYDVKNLRIKSVSGNAVGMLAPIDETATKNACGDKNTEKFFCAVGFMCVKWADWCCDGCYAGVELVPASGTWSVKYNASATKKANADKATLRSFVPEYMFYGTGSIWAKYRALDPFLHGDGYYYVDNNTGAFGYKTPNGGAGSVTEDRDALLDMIVRRANKVVDIVGDWTLVIEKDEEGVVTETFYTDGYKVEDEYINKVPVEAGVLTLDNTPFIEPAE